MIWRILWTRFYQSGSSLRDKITNKSDCYHVKSDLLDCYNVVYFWVNQLPSLLVVGVRLRLWLVLTFVQYWSCIVINIRWTRPLFIPPTPRSVGRTNETGNDKVLCNQRVRFFLYSFFSLFCVDIFLSTTVWNLHKRDNTGLSVSIKSFLLRYIEAVESPCHRQLLYSEAEVWRGYSESTLLIPLLAAYTYPQNLIPVFSNAVSWYMDSSSYKTNYRQLNQ